MTTLQENPRLWAEIEEYKRLKRELEVKLELLQETSIRLLDPLLSPKEQVQLQSIRNQTINYIEALRRRLKTLRDRILREANETGIDEEEILNILGVIPSEHATPGFIRVETEKGREFPKPSRVAFTPLLPPHFDELADIYEFLELIGQGGFAWVYKARRKKDGKVVALKIPKNLDTATGKVFLREISNWLHLKHSNIVELYDANILPSPYLEMEYCESSLEKLPKPMDVREASLLIFNIAEGLKYAHSKGIIHRDLKPSNVLLKAGIPKISDWGLSKLMSESRSSTLTTSFTLLYAAPEQLSKSQFGHTDERTDIWALGVIFYELVTGKLPFDGSDLGEITFSIIGKEPVPPSRLNPEAKLVEPIIIRMLAKRKEERYESVAELQQDLATYLGIELRNELKKSQTVGDRKKIIYYLGNLLLLSMKIGNLSGAYKYANDFTKMTSGKLKAQFEDLRDQIKLRMEEGLEIPVELIEKAEILVHEAIVG